MNESSPYHATDPNQKAAPKIHVKVFGRTDVGLVREHNEDNFLVADLESGNRSLLPEVREHFVGKHGTLLAVCDGMGGAAAGEVASQIAVDTVYELMSVPDPPKDVDDLARRLEQAVLDAGKKIFESARADRTRRGMGTTITAAALISRRMIFAQVGDSRAYVIREGKMVQVTRDQSLVNQLIEAGQLKPEEAELFEHSNIILQALGTAEDVTVDLTYVDLHQGDIVVMCSDGLSGLVSDERICELVLAGPEPIDACKALTEAAREGGGHDNITVIVAQFDGEALPPPSGKPVTFERLELEGRPPFAVRSPMGGASESEPETSSTEQTGSSSVAEASAHGDEPREERSNPTIMVAAIIGVLVLGVVIGYLIVSNMGGESGSEDQQPPPPPAQAPLPRPMQPVRTLFLADVEGARLLVDGQDYGQLPTDGRVIELPPGNHSVEARYGDNLIIPRHLEISEGQQEARVRFEFAPLIAATARANALADRDADMQLDSETTAVSPDASPVVSDGGVASAPAALGTSPANSDAVAPPPAATAAPALTSTDGAGQAVPSSTQGGGETPQQGTTRPRARPLTKLPPGARRPPRRPDRHPTGALPANPY